MNSIQNFSIELITSICEDISMPFNRCVILSPNISQNAFQDKIHAKEFVINSYEKCDLLISNLQLKTCDDIMLRIKEYENLLDDNGVLIMTMLSGESLKEFSNAMMKADLLQNRMITRVLPRIFADGLLNLAKQSKFKFSAVMNDTLKINFKSIYDLVSELRKMQHTIASGNTSNKEYWSVVQKIYESEYNMNTTFEFLTLFASK